jgi:hypothetical protein
MSELKVNKISPRSGTDVTLGDSGDTFTIPAGATLDTSGATLTLPTTIEVDAIEPQSGTTLTLGASGDTITIPSGATLSSTDPLVFPAGTASAPAVTTTGDTNTGIFFPAADTIAFTEGGTEAMRISSNGNVSIGSTGSGNRLFVADGNNRTEATAQLRISGSGYALFNFLDGTAAYIGQNSNSRSLRFYSGSNEAAGAQLSAGGTSFGTYSDERLKRNINDLGTCINKINSMRPITFNYISDEEDFKTRIGISAQSLVGQVDEALDMSKQNSNDETEYYNVRYQDLIPVLVKGIQEQQAIIEELKATTTSQQTKIDTLELRITALENI